MYECRHRPPTRHVRPMFPPDVCMASVALRSGKRRIACMHTMSLVVVDDDRDVSRALRRLLQSMGHDVRVFGSAEEYESSAPVADCLILDVRLPGLNGFELRDRLHRRG